MKTIEDFVAFLEKDEWYPWFQQDGATARTEKKKTDILAKFFEDRIISKGRWLARSPHLTHPDCVCVYLKNVYLYKPSSVDELKMKIKVQICAIQENSCEHVFENMIRRLGACQEIGRTFST